MKVKGLNIEQDLQTNPYTKRVQAIDIAKGFGIFLVIIGHLLKLYSVPSTVIYSFHMPLFFFLSGVFLSSKKNFFTFISGKIKRLLLPYVSAYAFGLFLSITIFSDKINWKVFFASVIQGKSEIIHSGGLWFLVCLFCASLLFYCFDRWILSHCNFWATCILLGAILIAGYYLPHLFKRYISFILFKVDVSFMALFFLIAGKNLKKKVMSIDSIARWKQALLCGICLLFVVGVSLFNGFVAFVNGEFGKQLFLFVFVSFCGITAVLMMSFILQNTKPGMLVAYFGKNSLFVLVSHYFLINILLRVYSRFKGYDYVSQQTLSYAQALVLFLVVCILMFGLIYLWNILKKVCTGKQHKRH